MSNGFKRAMAVLLTVFILFSLVPIGFTTGGEELFSESVVPGIGDGGALLAVLSEEPEGNANGNAGITITFKITNPNYTNDPATNFTHLTSNTPYTGGELTYTSWAGTYKVTGTGVVTSFTIPAGTSLAQNGLSAPRFSPFNLSSPTPNQYSYMAAYSWLTGDGRVCSENTVFTVSTELELSLHQDGEDYGIDFICCDEHDSWNSISYDCATMSPTFKLGNKLSEEYFITKERILARYANKNNHQLDGFAGWALKDYATGAFVPLTSNTSLTAAYLDPQYGRSFKAYAMWDEPAVPATATFRNGETTVEVRALSVGDALGTLPTVTAPEGQVFLGWREMNANSAFVSAETVISADTTYETVFGAAGYCSAVFHDILPDGTAAGTAVTRSVPAGTRFADIEDAALSDGAMLSECLWHTAPGTAPIDNSAYVVSSDAAFYTYTYQVVLNFTPDAPLAAMASAVEATPGENGVMTITITAREGEPLTLSDFIIDGVDYSLYEWTYTDDQNNMQTLDIDDLIANGLSCNIVAASSGEPASADVTPVSNYPVNFYIFIDGAREKLAARSVTAYKIWDPTAYNSSTRSNSGNYRYYLLAETLADVYGDFGFRTSDLTVGTRYFPNATKNEANMWADAAVQVIDGRTFSALGLRVEEMDVYYLPKQSLTANSGAWTNYQTTDSFYSVTVQDPDGLFYAEGDLPAPTYTLNGRTAAASVLNTALDPAQNAIWTAAGANTHTAAAGTENQDGTVTFAIPAISEPYIITASLLQLDTQISYDINLPVIPDGTSPTIGGAAACTDTPAAGETTYTVLAPSLLSYAYTSSDHEPGTAAFLGWAVNGNTDAEDLVQPGAELNLYDYGDVITLTAQWSMELTSLGTVTFHDMLPGGGEAGTPIELVLPVGSSLTGIEDETLSDGTLISECVWYTAGGSGPISLADYEAADGAEFYTYTHRLVLNYAPGEPDAQTITITAREGEPLSALDFVVNGVDYSLYSWTYEDDLGVTQTLDIPNLIVNGLTDSIEAAGNGALAFSGLTPEPGHTINFYIFIDEQRVKLETRTGVTAYCNGSLTQSGNRRYLPAAILESVYGDFGFSAAQLVSGTRYFPHVDANGGNIWADTPVLEQNGYFFSPIISHPHTTGTDVYYLPKQSLTANSGAWANFQTTDSFYSVTVEDPDEFVYATADVPEVSYTFKGQMAAVTVSGIPPAEEDNVIWTCTGRTTGTAIDGTVNSDDTVTFIIENISEPYVIQAGLDNGVRRITYDINRPHPPVDEEYECPTIQGGDTYIETTAEGADTYTVRAPSLTSYFYATYNTNGVLQKHIGEATFLGWAVNGDTDAEDLVQPGDMLNLSDYSGTIHLDAQWNAECANTQNRVGSMVNYYVSLAAHLLGYSTEWTGDIDQAYFTDSVYTDDCGVDAGIIPDLELYETHYLTEKVNQYFVLGGTSGTDINESHAEIISELSAGYTLTSPVDHADYTFQLTFPSDEQVLHRIRQLMMQGGPRSHIIINGSEVTVDEMNTANFSVRWYVFKYDVTDGWHIDGVLVSKPGTIRVTKTFAGDADAIEAVKENYSISVAAAPGQNGVVHTGETLELGNAEHAEGSNVYAWNVPVDRYYRYVVSETNYIYTENTTTTTAWYEILNAKDSSEDTAGWTPYTASLTVTGQCSYAEDPPLTVNFLNTYTKPGMLTLHKVDSVTGHGMDGLIFDVKDEDGYPITLYCTSGNYYTTIQSGAETSTCITTDASGQAFITLSEGTYQLEERVPYGYEDPGTITVTLERVDGDVVLTNVYAENPDVVSHEENTLTLSLRNHSETTDLIARKIWAEGIASKSVTIRLYRNGEPVGSAVTLDGTAETPAWTHVFANVPLYVDGEPAVYTIREESIGDFHYSPEYSDGYYYYTVTYSALTYLDAQGQPTTEMDGAVSLLLSVTNRRDIGALSILKVDEYGNPLPGAVFKLYSADVSEGETPAIPAGAAALKTGISENNGVVDFGTVNEGEYYLVEYEPPEGYEQSDALYRLKTEGSAVTMERWNGTGWVSVPNCTVVNNRTKTDVVISKMVTGTMGDHSRAFGFTVRCTEPMAQSQSNGYDLSEDRKTATFTLRHSQSVTLNGIPVGARLTITESNAEPYTVSITAGGIPVGDGEEITVEKDIVIIVNNRMEFVPDVGVLLDSLPYVLILAGVIAVAAFMFIRKRRNKDDD